MRDERTEAWTHKNVYTKIILIFILSPLIDWKSCARQLDDNALMHLDDISLAKLKCLRALRLEGNMLQRVPTEALTGLPTLEILWVCLSNHIWIDFIMHSHYVFGINVFFRICYNNQAGMGRMPGIPKLSKRFKQIYGVFIQTNLSNIVIGQFARKIPNQNFCLVKLDLACGRRHLRTKVNNTCSSLVNWLGVWWNGSVCQIITKLVHFFIIVMDVELLTKIQWQSIAYKCEGK